jgi:hypothetical protein
MLEQHVDSLSAPMEACDEKRRHAVDYLVDIEGVDKRPHCFSVTVAACEVERPQMDGRHLVTEAPRKPSRNGSFLDVNRHPGP